MTKPGQKTKPVTKTTVKKKYISQVILAFFKLIIHHTKHDLNNLPQSKHED